MEEKYFVKKFKITRKGDRAFSYVFFSYFPRSKKARVPHKQARNLKHCNYYLNDYHEKK